MISWRIEEEGYDRERISNLGNKYLVGNGYIGIRGTMQEYQKSQFPAINLAGIYDQVGDAWREPLNAPNGLYTEITFNKVSYRLPEVEPEYQKVAVNYRHAIQERRTIWATPEGKLCVTAETFASMQDKHLILLRYEVQSDAAGELKLSTGIDGDVWDINGPHYDAVEHKVLDNVLLSIGTTHECNYKVCVSETYEADFITNEVKSEQGRKNLRELTLQMEANKVYTIYKYIGIFTSKDTDDYEKLSLDTVTNAKMVGFSRTMFDHKEAWEKLWNISEVEIDGDDAAMEALNYSIYHLHCIAPRHSKELSIAARGLSGQTYKGAVFWDTEMFMLDFFLFTEPEVAKTLLKYRITTLEGAKKKAKSYGYQGAFYAWESQEGGYDACSDYNVTDVFTGRQMRTFFKDKQIHISAAVAYGIMRYVNYTGNYDLLSEGGAEVILECAKFYYDLLLKKVDGKYYELHDVIGPDEYHERVNNNAYTNRMAKYTFESAVRIITELSNLSTDSKHILEQRYDLNLLLSIFQDASQKLYIPQPNKDTGVIEQFDGYEHLEDVSIEEVKSRLLHEKEYWGGAYGVATHTKVIKQADVVTMLNLFSAEYLEEILFKNWTYYEPRTEHGSSLSACMYAILACKCKMPDQAYPFFMKSAMSDITQKGKEWAGLIYIGGTHPASSGGAYMTAIEGFAGIHQEGNELKANPCLPSNWNSMRFKIVFRGELYQALITKDNALIERLINTLN
jgi:kojibiose phosphorylase/nigerose phosphorylase